MKPDVPLEQVGFWRRQVRQYKEGGLSVLLRKYLLILPSVPSIPVVLILRALRPLVLVRFGFVASHAIGHFAYNTELYLCERDAGLHSNKRTLDIFCYDPFPITNQQLKKMWERTLHIYSPVRGLARANRLLPGGASHVIPFPYTGDFHGLLPRSNAHLVFTPREELAGQSALQNLGIPEGAPFVCIHSRDTSYRDANPHVNETGRNDYRNTSIQNYMNAAEELTQRGYFVVRMGAVVNETVETTNPMIIDYATIARSDFMDIYLAAKCSFFLGCTAGLHLVPIIFRRPVIRTNFVPIHRDDLLADTTQGLTIPKKLWLREERRFMTFREFLATFSDSFRGNEHFQNIGVDLIENTPEELLAVAVEMDERLKETWQITKEDKELQERFWSLFELTDPNEDFRPRLGAEFLRHNPELLA